MTSARVLPTALNADDELATLDLVDIGWRIRRLRKDRGWSQDDLAIATDVQRWAVSNWEHGIRQPSMVAFLRLADAFDCRLDWLVRGDVPCAR